MISSKALVTGGAGFIGSHLCDELLSRGKQVTVIDDLSTGSLSNIVHLEDNPKFRFLRASVLSTADLAPEIEKADVIYHMAAAVGVRYIHDNLVSSLETNVEGTKNVLRLASSSPNKKVILASSSEVYGKSSKIPFKENDDTLVGPTSVPRWGYACSKALDEFMALAYHKEQGASVVVLRLFNTVGPRQSGYYGMVMPRFIQQAATGEPITIYGTGLQQRSFTYVKDVVAAIADIAEEPSAEGQIFNVGSDSEISIIDLANLVRRVLGSQSEIVHIPFAEVYGEGFEEPARRLADIAKIRRYINYHPSTDVESVIREIANSINTGESR